jgi:two-component system, response regulator PdtaR
MRGRESRTTQQPARILIVEDDYLISVEAEAALIEAGYEVVGTAVTADEAIAMATLERPSLIIMDIRLASARDGIDAAREIFQTLNIRCVFATAHDDPGTHERAEPCAPLGWILKPYTTGSLKAHVDQALAKLR